MTAVMPRLSAISAIAGLLLCACGPRDGRGAPPVPKPDAWPRIEIAPEAYGQSIDGFAVNDSATIEPGDSAGWYTLSYPAYGAATRIYLTMARTAPGGLADAVANRIERMALNAGGGRSQLTELMSEGGYECRVMTTPAGTVTPVQFLAFRRSGGEIVSGALFIDGAATAEPDSFAPVVRAVERDIIHALKHLK